MATDRKLREAYTKNGIFLGHYETGPKCPRGQHRRFYNRDDFAKEYDGKIKTRAVPWATTRDLYDLARAGVIHFQKLLQ